MLALSREYERYLFVLAEFAEAQKKSRRQRETLEAYVSRKQIQQNACARERERQNWINLRISMGLSPSCVRPFEELPGLKKSRDLDRARRSG
jgi:hypothetical protein